MDFVSGLSAIFNAIVGSPIFGVLYDLIANQEYKKAADEARANNLGVAADLLDVAEQNRSNMMEGSSGWDKDLGQIITERFTTNDVAAWEEQYGTAGQDVHEIWGHRSQYQTPEGDWDWEAIEAGGYDVEVIGERFDLGPRPGYIGITELFGEGGPVSEVLDYFNPATAEARLAENYDPILEQIVGIPETFGEEGRGVVEAGKEAWRRWGPETYGEEILDKAKEREAAGLATGEDILALAQERLETSMGYLEGYGEQARADIAQSWQNEESRAMAQLEAAGYGGTSYGLALSAGYESQEQADVNRLNELLARLNLETYGGLTGEQLDIMGGQQGVTSGLSGDVINQMTYRQAIGLADPLPGLLQTQQFGGADVGFTATGQRADIAGSELTYGADMGNTFLGGTIASGMAPIQQGAQATQLMYTATGEPVHVYPQPPQSVQQPQVYG